MHKITWSRLIDIGVMCLMANGMQVSGQSALPPDRESEAILKISGTYPHLTAFGNDGECGIGAVASWANKLWFITYPPHKPEGSPEKLYTVDTNFNLVIRSESVGGTHANRMIHRESEQLIIGPYFIGKDGAVRTADIHQLRARLTANARHLTDPEHRIYFFGMEKELYDVDVNTLAVTRIYGENKGLYPGTHGKGAYSGQGRLVIAHNGESGWSLIKDPGFNGPAGVLAESNGENWRNQWQIAERNNFCEVTGPGGIYGNTCPNDPIWATGWDKRSVILKLLDHGHWHTYRLPKGSYSHDALHGWYTEWPRIREVNEGKLLMHMHGLFYFFPKTFSTSHTAGIQPICTYLKMPVDYCDWNGQLVMARDDVSIMQNSIAGQSHSTLWLGKLEDLSHYGAPAGWGGPWKDDAVKADKPSDPFLVAGFRKIVLHLEHQNPGAVDFTLDYDRDGNDVWVRLDKVQVPANGYAWYVLPYGLNATWIRLTPNRDTAGVTAYFHLGNPPIATDSNIFAGIAGIDAHHSYSDGIFKPGNCNARKLQFAANIYGVEDKLPEIAYYEIGGAFKLERVVQGASERAFRNQFGLTNAGFSVDAASVIVVEGTNRFRLPKNSPAYDSAFPSGWPRGKREVVTERNLFNAHGTFYEVPRADSGGFCRLRPITTHNKHISDFGAWRGLLVIAGTPTGAANDHHFFRSEDGRTGLWFGDVDDLWRLGKPVGIGGPWKNSAVEANTPSDPYLMFGYEHRTLELSHDQSKPLMFIVEVDFTADGVWSEYGRFIVPPGQVFQHTFPDIYSVHWVRLKLTQSAQATAWLTYH